MPGDLKRLRPNSAVLGTDQCGSHSLEEETLAFCVDSAGGRAGGWLFFTATFQSRMVRTRELTQLPGLPGHEVRRCHQISHEGPFEATHPLTTKGHCEPPLAGSASGLVTFA